MNDPKSTPSRHEIVCARDALVGVIKQTEPDRATPSIAAVVLALSWVLGEGQPFEPTM